MADAPRLRMFATRPVCGGVDSDQRGQTDDPDPNLGDAVDALRQDRHPE